MKNVLVLLFLVFCGVANGQIIDFPDANFKKALVNTNCADLNGDGITDTDADINNDGEIDMDEALNVSLLYVKLKSITNLDGIENFKNLTTLNCGNNKLTSLNVQGLTKLTNLECSVNQLTSLNVEGLTMLTYLGCSQNHLKSLNVQGLTKLTTLFCIQNELTSINVQGLTNLKNFSCVSNKLISLDVQGLSHLIDLNCGYNQLIFLNVQGLTSLTDLYCTRNQITSLDLQGLTNLNNLYCAENRLISLNVQGLSNLTNLNCDKNQLTTLDVQGLINLTTLVCTENKLTSLNLVGSPNIVNLNCTYNQLTNLELKGLSKLEGLQCGNNKLESLNLKETTKLARLDCRSNNLTSLNVIGLLNMKTMYCQENQLTNLDAQGLLYLTLIYCQENQLTNLDVQGLVNLSTLYCYNNKLTTINCKGTEINFGINFFNNPSLIYICCNEKTITNIKNEALANGQNCEINSYCTFTPGGKYYVLKGKNMFDFNNNGCEGQGINLQSTKFNITNTIGNITGAFISNSTGNYSTPLQAGTHTITPILEYPSHFVVTPSSYTITFPSTSDTITQDFCITPKGIFRQTNITVIPLSPPARPGFDVSYKIVWENVGNQIENGTLNFTYDETLLDYISATQTADQVADGIVKWNFTNLLPFEKREITVTLKVNRPTETPAVNAGDKLYLTASILDNIFTLENTVVGSYDPNDKTCLQGDRVKPDMVGKYVDYLIRFENTGNYAAENVVVKDIIDTKTFDVSTLKITDSSHEVYTRIEGNKVEFIFENIQLPFDDANNDGYIAFKIKTLPSLILGDSLKNLADIYFDYNFPIRTNEAQTTVAFPVFTKDNTTEVNIYPNPVSDVLYLDTNENWTKVEIYDISGRIMRSASLNGQSIDVSELESGTYFIRLKDGERLGLVKFVKM